ncbi:Uncharacterised protein [Serratia fonticola]|nr:Uncharacterised protein [Serratia fonticola]
MRILREGSQRANQVTQGTLAQVKSALGLDFFALD